MKKVVLQVFLHDEEFKKKVMKRVSGVTGVVSIAVDMKENTLTVIGDIDSYTLEHTLRKICGTQTISVVELKPQKDDQNIKKNKGSTVGGKPLPPSVRRPPNNGNDCTIL